MKDAIFDGFNFNKVPRLRKTEDEKRYWTYKDDTFFEPIKKNEYSFIVIIWGSPDDPTLCRIEGYDGDDITIYMIGTFDECVEGLKRIRDAMKKDGISYETESLDPETDVDPIFLGRDNAEIS